MNDVNSYPYITDWVSWIYLSYLNISILTYSESSFEILEKTQNIDYTLVRWIKEVLSAVDIGALWNRQILRRKGKRIPIIWIIFLLAFANF